MAVKPNQLSLEFESQVQPRSRFQIQLDAAQRAAVEHVHGPMLVIAGAGTGKTTVLEHRVAHLISNHHAAPGEILALTYTENAARSLHERIGKLLASEGISGTGFRASTFHAYCYGLIRKSGKAFQVVGREDLWVYLRRNISRLPLERFIKAANPGKFLDDLLNFYDRCRDELVRACDYNAYVQRLRAGDVPLPRVGRTREFEELSRAEVIAYCEEIARVYIRVEEMLGERNMGTFGDMIVGALDVLKQDSAALERERARARFILIDEFQDSNVAQIELAALLAGSAENIFAVGDPDQAIYRFRGATSGAFDEFARRFPDLRRERLERNHRSLSPILQSSFGVIAKNPEVAGWKRTFLHSAREEQPRNQGESVGSSPVSAVMTTDICAEAADIAESIQEKHSRANTSSERLQWQEFAVLYRTHAHREQLTEELAARGIPFTVTGVNVLESGPIRDLVAALSAIVVARDAISLFRLAALPRFKISPTALHHQLQQTGREPDLVAALDKVKGGRALLDAIQNCRAWLPEAPKASQLVSRVVEVFGLDIPADALLVFRKFVEEWEKKPITDEGSLLEFLNYLEFFKEARGYVPLEEPDEHLDAVRLLTAHAAKGLEWKQVHVIRLNAGSFPLHFQEALFGFPDALRHSPHGGSDSDRKLHMEEERRLLYVAMTRAADRLLLYARPGRGQDKTPDGFLRDLLKDRSLGGVVQQRPARSYIRTSAAPVASPASVAGWLELPAQRNLRQGPLSASAIESYKICPLRFKIEHDWRLPSEPAAAMQFGNVMHSALKFYFDELRSGRPCDIQGLLRRFEELMSRMPFEDPVQRQLYLKQGAVQLRTFVETHKAAPPLLVIHTERTFKIEIGGVEIVGRMDRLDALDSGPNRIAITDYKTGRPRDQKDAEQSLQLSIYAIAAMRAWSFQPERLVFYNLEDNSRIETCRTADQLRAHEEEVRQVACDIAAGKFDPAPGFHCRSCGYFSLCPKTEQRLYSIQKTLRAVPSGAN